METIKFKGCKIKTYHDEDPMNPREWDNLGFMLCFHSRYNLGDKHKYRDYDDFMHSLACEYFQPHQSITDEAIMARFAKDHIVLPLYLYDHSGITMSCSPFSCIWDSSQVGIIYVSKEKAKTEYGWKTLTSKRIEQIKSCLKAEVEIYDNYLTGNVFRYEITRKGECIESGNGFYHYEDMVEQAKASL